MSSLSGRVGDIHQLPRDCSRNMPQHPPPKQPKQPWNLGTFCNAVVGIGAKPCRKNSMRSGHAVPFLPPCHGTCGRYLEDKFPLGPPVRFHVSEREGNADDGDDFLFSSKSPHFLSGSVKPKSELFDFSFAANMVQTQKVESAGTPPESLWGRWGLVKGHDALSRGFGLPDVGNSPGIRFSRPEWRKQVSTKKNAAGPSPKSEVQETQQKKLQGNLPWTHGNLKELQGFFLGKVKRWVASNKEKQQVDFNRAEGSVGK